MIVLDWSTKVPTCHADVLVKDIVESGEEKKVLECLLNEMDCDEVFEVLNIEKHLPDEFLISCIENAPTGDFYNLLIAVLQEMQDRNLDNDMKLVFERMNIKNV